MLDTAVNFARGTVSAITATTVTYTKTGAQDFPNPTLLPGDFNPDAGYNIVIWDSTDYTSPSLDPNAMIFRVTSWVSGTLTGYWVGQNEAVVAQATPSLIAGKTYTVIFGPTAKSFTNMSYLNSRAFVRLFSDFENVNYGNFVTLAGGGTRAYNDQNQQEGVLQWTVTTNGDEWGVTSGSSYYQTGSLAIKLSSTPIIIRSRLMPWNAQGTVDNADFVFFMGFYMFSNGGGLPTKENANSDVYAVGFLIDPSGSDTNPLNIQCVSENGTNASRTVVDSGVAFGQAGPIPLATPAMMTLEVRMTDTAAYFWINGVLVATITTNLPTAPPYNMSIYYQFAATSAASSNSNSMAIDYAEAIYPRPFP